MAVAVNETGDGIVCTQFSECAPSSLLLGAEPGMLMFHIHALAWEEHRGRGRSAVQQSFWVTAWILPASGIIWLQHNATEVPTGSGCVTLEPAQSICPVPPDCLLFTAYTAYHVSSASRQLLLRSSISREPVS